MTKVLGIDIGAKFVVAFLLDGLPSETSYKDFYRKNARFCLHKIRLDNKKKKDGTDLKNAIELLSKLSPDVIVLEPTGVWYSRLWARIADHLGIEIRWIAHTDLSFNRGHYGFEDKDDRTDAFCLAVSYFDPVFDARNPWLKWRTAEVARVNDLILAIDGLKGPRTAQTNQLRQRLCYEWPELSQRAISRARTPGGFTAWLGYLADIHHFTRIRNERTHSIATELGIEISNYTRDHALAICTSQIREKQLLADLEDALSIPEFTPYITVMEKIGFGPLMQGIILAQVYPLDKFLLDGEPWIDRWADDRKQYKRHKSLRAFQISLGFGKRLVESGGSKSLKYSGSAFAREKLYAWIVTNVLSANVGQTWLVKEIDRRALNNQKPSLTVAELRKRWRDTAGSNKDRHQAGVRSAITIGYRLTRILYDELLREVLS
jgi:hypothetical protein